MLFSTILTALSHCCSLKHPRQEQHGALMLFPIREARQFRCEVVMLELRNIQRSSQVSTRIGSR
jgi:hypothetical protein